MPIYVSLRQPPIKDICFVNEINAKAESLLANSKQNLTGKDNFFHVGNVLSMCILLCQKCCIEL